MQDNNIKQNPLDLSEEEKIIHKPRMDRREWLTCDPNKWPQRVKQEAICPLKIDIEPELQLELYEIAQTLEYENVHRVLHICLWPDCAATQRLEEKFAVFGDDIFRRIVLRCEPYEIVYPHKDTVRGTSIYLPLGPSGAAFKPLEIYYDNEENGIPENHKPIVYAWNAKATHAVFNSESFRYNIQLSINLPYAEVFKKYNDLFDI